jgi:hypothetical protein
VRKQRCTIQTPRLANQAFVRIEVQLNTGHLLDIRLFANKCSPRKFVRILIDGLQLDH